MSEARDKFFEILSPAINRSGFVFKKSKMNFVLQEGEIISNIDFNWDGRGGLTYLNHILGAIYISYINKTFKILLNYKHPYPMFTTFGKGQHFDDRIPQMYSPELLNLANNMAFKNMAALTFEEKYPMDNIRKSVNSALKIITGEIIPELSTKKLEQQLLDFRINKLTEKLNLIETHNIMWEVLIVKIMCKKMKLIEPKFVTDIQIFTNKSIDDLWNMQDYDFENMEAKFNQLVF